MTNKKVLILAVLAAGACNRGGGGAGCGAGEKVQQARVAAKAKAPATPPAEWTAADIAGTWGWGCDDKSWADVVLEAAGAFTWRAGGEGDVMTVKGKIVREGDRLTLSDKPARLAGPFSGYFLRFHDGRKVMVRQDHVASFDLLPSWQQAFVKLKAGETRAQMCKQMAPWPGKNPPSPDAPSVRLPGSFTVTMGVTEGPSTVQAALEVKSAPFWAQTEMCQQGCSAPEKVRFNRAGDWAKLNKLWWAQASAPAACPAADPPVEPYALVHDGKTHKGDLAGEVREGTPCAARRDMLAWIGMKIATRHPPAAPPRR